MLDLYETIKVSKTVIFRNTRKGVETLADQLNKNDFTVSAIVSSSYIMAIHV